MDRTYDLAIVGGGILGTFHAYFALQKGLKVALFEKNSRPLDATVRNFGQVVPSGMNSKWQMYGRTSLSTYRQIQSEFDISLRKSGSLYIASNHEEVQLLEELHQINRHNDYNSKLLTKQKCLENYPGLRWDYVRAGLFFPQEVTLEPKTMIHRLHGYLKAAGLHLYLGTQIVECNELLEDIKLHTVENNTFSAKKVIVCNGSDFRSLYPELFQESDLKICKLQMMQTRPQLNYTLKGSILTGLSIRRYEAFKECPSFAGIKSREAQESLVKKWGVHILFKQAIDGSIILGDSHEYADTMDDLGYELNMDIDNLIIHEAKKIFDLPHFDIQSRWMGFYSQCKKKDIYQYQVDRNIQIVTGIGGKGMTVSAGYAKENIDKIFNLEHA